MLPLFHYPTKVRTQSTAAMRYLKSVQNRVLIAFEHVVAWFSLLIAIDSKLKTYKFLLATAGRRGKPNIIQMNFIQWKIWSLTGFARFWHLRESLLPANDRRQLRWFEMSLEMTFRNSIHRYTNYSCKHSGFLFYSVDFHFRVDFKFIPNVQSKSEQWGDWVRLASNYSIEMCCRPHVIIP